jgi:hypothetical protein
MTTAPLSTSMRHRRYQRRSEALETAVRHEVFRLGRNPRDVMRERGFSRSMIERICCYGIEWRKWGKA